MGTKEVQKRVLVTLLPYERLSDANERKYAFRHALSKLNIVADTRIDTMSTDGFTIRVNEDFIGTLTDKQLVAILEHEVLHVVLKHMDLFTVIDPFQKNKTKFNMAADLEINSHIANLPEGVIYPSDYGFEDGKGTVWYYQNLKDSDVQQQQDRENQDFGTSGSPDDSSSDGEPSSNVGGVEPRNVNEVGTDTALSDADIVNVGKAYSLTGNNSVQEIINDNFNNSIIERLLKMVRKRQNKTYTRQLQSRSDRQLFGRTSTQLRPNRFAVYVDMSGSMAHYWKYFDSFIRQLEKKDARYVGMFNTDLYDYDPKNFGGGTDIKCVASHAFENDYTPIVFTDGEYREVKMPKNTIYVLTEKYHKNNNYGKNVYVLKQTKYGLK